MRNTSRLFCKNYFELTQEKIKNNLFLKNMMKNSELTVDQLKYLRSQRAFFYKHFSDDDPVDRCFENEIEKRLCAQICADGYFSDNQSHRFH